MLAIGRAGQMMNRPPVVTCVSCARSAAACAAPATPTSSTTVQCLPIRAAVRSNRRLVLGSWFLVLCEGWEIGGGITVAGSGSGCMDMIQGSGGPVIGGPGLGVVWVLSLGTLSGPLNLGQTRPVRKRGVSVVK